MNEWNQRKGYLTRENKVALENLEAAAEPGGQTHYEAGQILSFHGTYVYSSAELNRDAAQTLMNALIYQGK